MLRALRFFAGRLGFEVVRVRATLRSADGREVVTIEFPDGKVVVGEKKENGEIDPAQVVSLIFKSR